MSMTRAFRHTFEPAHQNPISGQDVHLTIREIEDAGLLEVVQTPGAAFGSWAVLESLLQPGPRFVFREPLGQAREVKVALSGLFGRFVARAYLQRYFNLSIFKHLDRRNTVLDRRREIRIERRAAGDLPDWVVCTNNFANVIVAEAKGCHDRSGPGYALRRAWNQAGRIDVVAKSGRVTVKRIAIATRWGMRTDDGPQEPWITVHDPIDEGDPIAPDDEKAMFTGLVRHHIANMISPLGHAELAEALRNLSNLRLEQNYRQVTQQALSLLEKSTARGIILATDDAEFGDMIIGGVVTRAGPPIDVDVSFADWNTMARLGLRPILIGVERELVLAAITGDLSSMRKLLVQRPISEGEAHEGHAASRVIRLT